MESAKIAEPASRARKAIVPVGRFFGADELDALGLALTELRVIYRPADRGTITNGADKPSPLIK